MKKSLVGILLLFISTCAFAGEIANGPIPIDEVLFGLEGTFQTIEMVKEPGRMTFSTPYKKEKFEQFIEVLTSMHSSMWGPVSIESIGHYWHKPGKKLTFANGQTIIADMEPVCIEINLQPMTIDQILERWTLVYIAADRIKLQPYVNTAAERSGMGHIHIGGATVGQNPFIKFPLLLRNMLVLFHKHPSLLWGFGEAYDIGNDSNIESFHIHNRQQAFQSVIEEFDRWYAQAGSKEQQEGPLRLIRLLHKAPGNLISHYRFINLESMRSLGHASLDDVRNYSGKYTVEFRAIRPYKSSSHAEAMAELILSLMQIMAKEGHVENFEYISEEDYMQYHAVSSVSEDWQQLKSTLKLPNNYLWDEMINEYVQNLESQKRISRDNEKLSFIPAYSEKDLKGRFVEVRFEAKDNSIYELNINGKSVPMRPIGSSNLVSVVIDIDKSGLSFNDLVSANESLLSVSQKDTSCQKWLDPAA